MELRRTLIATLAAIFAISGIGSILVMQQQPDVVDAIELVGDDRDTMNRRPDDDAPILEAVDDDDDADDSVGGLSATGDGDATAGDDGTSGGANTVDNTNDATDTGADTGGDTDD